MKRSGLLFALVGLLALVPGTPARAEDGVTDKEIVIGAGLFALGAAMLAGFELNVRLPRLDRGGRERTVGSIRNSGRMM